MSETLMNNKIAFVIVGWNNKKLLEECLSSIKNQTYIKIEIIYVDNASTDGSVEFVKNNFPKVKVLAQIKNTGFAKGNNIGISAALKDPEVNYVALLNTDARLTNDWTEKIITFALNKTKGAFYQGTNLDYYDHSVIDSTHIYISRNGQGTQGNWRYYQTTEIGPLKVFGVNAAACIISRSFIDACSFNKDFFFERLFMYLEDVDLAARSLVMGWDSYLVPGARAYHMGSASSKKNPGFSLYLTFRNNSAVLFKNLPLKVLLRMLPTIFRGDIDTIRHLYRSNKNQAIYHVLRGRIIGIIRLPLFFRRRFLVQQHSQVNNEYLKSLMDKGY